MGSVEEVRRFVAEMARRRVFQVVAVYGGGAFALLQSADVVVDALSLSPTLVTFLTVVILLGFPVAIAVGWIYDLDAAGRLRRTSPASTEPGTDDMDEGVAEPAAPASPPSRRLGWPLKVTGVAAFVLFVTAGWLIATRISPPAPAYAVSDPRGSYLVAPVHARSESRDDLELAERTAARLMFKLRGWESVRVVQEFALTGMLYELEIGAGHAPSLDQTFQMARTQQVGTVVGLRVTTESDSAHMEAVLYDVASQREIGAPILETAARDDLDGLVAPVASARQTRAIDRFGAGVLARYAGSDSIAAAQFRHVQACPLSLDALDEGWGLRTLSRLFLARTLEDLGDTVGAATARSGFTPLWRGRPGVPENPIRR